MRWIDQLVQDVRFGARTLRRNPGFAVTTVLMLALATGATTAIFSIFDGVLLRPLPFADPDRLVQLYGRAWTEDRGETVPDPLTGPVGSIELETFASRSTSFDALAGYTVATRHLDGAERRERLTAVVADFEFFSLLGTSPVAGRTFRSDDPRLVAVISDRLWQRRFDRDRRLLGSTIMLDGRPFTVLGVMPETFQFPYGAASLMPGALPESRTDLWIPLEPVRTLQSGELRRGRVSVIGRLKPAVALEAAAAELRALAAHVEAVHPNADARVGVRLVPLSDVVGGPVRRSLWLLFAAVSLVLAAACANMANLLLARMTVRTQEVATRAALGADRLRLVRQFLAESLMLSLVAGLIGALIARWGTNLLVALGSARIPRAHEITLDWHAFGFLLLACVMTAALFGLAPALTAARIAAHAGRHATPGRGHVRLRDGLAVTEVALAFVLTLGAALVMREASRLQSIETGMTTDGVLTLHMTPRAPVHEYDTIERRVALLPGVRAAGLTQLLPLQNWGWEGDLSITGRPPTERSVAGLRYVTPGYFDALGIPVLLGRGFTEMDHADSQPVILINNALARRYFPGEDPIDVETDRGTIVGVVGDVRQVSLDREAEPELYYPVAQNHTMAGDIGMTLIVRGSGSPERLVDAVRATVRDVNPELAVFNIKTMDRVLADALWELNLYRWLIGLFAALALVIAAIGLYGVISYGVTSRMREFAIRLALGSNPSRLAALALAQGVRLTGAGLAAGGLVALAATPPLRNLSSGLHAGPMIYAIVAAILLTLALAASIVPATRIAAVHPADALRHD